MAVSRFLKFPIQNEFIGKILAHLNPAQRVLDPHGVGGYMRKQVVCNSIEELRVQLQCISTLNYL